MRSFLCFSCAFCVVFFCTRYTRGSNLGVPPIHSFAKNSYNAGTQNWDIKQDSRGRLLFANNEGLLIFNGSSWSLFRLPNGTIMRSLELDQERIFVGGQGELGFFAPDEFGRLHYNDLTTKFEGAMPSFADVWDIEIADSKVFFRTSNHVFVLQNDAIRIVHRGGNLFLGKCREAVFLQNRSGKLFQWVNSGFQPYSKGKFPGDIRSLLPLDSGAIMAFTRLHGVFAIDNLSIQSVETQSHNRLVSSRVYDARKLKSGKYAVGTTLEGLLLLDDSLEVIAKYGKGQGLRNNNVLCIEEDVSNNIWIGLDNGISMIEIASPYRNVVPSKELEGAAYAGRLHKQKLYLGTSNALYCQSEYAHSEDQFSAIKGTIGQVWGLNEVGGQLWLGHHEGAFIVEEGKANKISDYSTWRFLELSDTAVLAGEYEGLSIYYRNPQGWKREKILPEFKESCRILRKAADGSIWMSHPYKGLFRFELSEPRSWNFYGKERGLPSNLNNQLLQIEDQVLVGTPKGVFSYNSEQDNFEPASDYFKFLPKNERISNLVQRDSTHFYFVSESKAGKLVHENGAWKTTILEGLKPQLVGGFEFIHCLSDSLTLFGVENGFLLYDDFANTASSTRFEPLISRFALKLPKDSLLCGSFGESTDLSIGLKTEQNSLSFELAYPSMDKSIRFQSRLVGLEEDWGIADHSPLRIFNHLAPGNYDFQARVLFADSSVSETVSQSFEIAAPWYSNKLARLLYLILGFLMLIWLIRKQKQRFEQEKQELLLSHQSEVLAQSDQMAKTQREIDKLKRERLEVEVEHKNRELASATLHLVQKNELIQKVQNKLSRLLKEDLSAEEKQNEVKQTLGLMSAAANSEEHWHQFSQHFDQVHSDFLRKLRMRYPVLTNNDLKLCAYLRLNLSTKEIATLINISIRGVEGSRYRLRKKLGLNKEQKLSEFLLQV